MVRSRSPFLRRHRWLAWLACGLLAALAAFAVVVAILAHRAQPFLRARLVAELQQRFHARVELDSFRFSLAGGLWAEGKGLRIWPPAQAAGVAIPGPGQPLIALDAFRFHAPLRFQPGQPIRIPIVQLQGLHIVLPPHSHFQHPAASSSALENPALLRFSVAQIQCTGGTIEIQTANPAKLPLHFDLAGFQLTSVAAGSATAFAADLTNPRPVGIIHATGSFGPWIVSDPGQSPIAGSYSFSHADLSSFKGIAGILNSTGQYQGTLRDLTVDGQADVPNFSLTHFGASLPLHTRFHALVDGTNGDTHLDPVDATLGRSHFTAQGDIVRVTAPAADGALHSLGHDIALTVNVGQARIEDFLRLASPPDKAAPLLTGSVLMQAKLHVPPGPLPVHRRMTISGGFTLARASFTNPKIQSRIAELSLRGQGRPDDVKTVAPATILSTMQGRFQLAAAAITLPALSFTVPGAAIALSGNYDLESGALNFTGSAKMDATVSKMVGGWKGLLLKPADRYFRKNGVGADVPIHIEGTREEPKFGIDFDRMKAR